MHVFPRLFLPALLSLLCMAGPAKASQDILVGGGSVTGVYYQVALQICNLVNQHAGDQYHCVGRPALGSVFNINAVSRGLLDFGVAQSDVNWQAYSGHADWEGKPVGDLRSVFSLYPETVLLVTRAETEIKSVADLKGKRVNIGNPGSGQRVNAEDVLRLYQIDPERDIKAVGLQQHDASRALVDRKIDAFFFTAGNPSAAIQEPANSTDIRIVPINNDAIKAFVSERPYYVMTTIPAGTYKGVDEPVETFAVKATVVTSAGAGADMVYAVTKTLFQHIDALRAAHAAFRHLEPQDMLGGLSAPLHEGAARYYREQEWALPNAAAAE